MAQAQCLIGPSNQEMHHFILGLIEDKPEIPYVQTDSKDWASDNIN
jgi:hypothetical protein